MQNRYSKCIGQIDNLRKEIESKGKIISKLSATLKVCLTPFKKNNFICFNERLLKMMKNAFISSEKLFSFSRYLIFYHDFFVMQRNGLIRKIRLMSKFMTSTRG